MAQAITYQLMVAEKPSGDYHNSGDPSGSLDEVLEFTKRIEHNSFLWQVVRLQHDRPEAIVASNDPDVEVKPEAAIIDWQANGDARFRWHIATQNSERYWCDVQTWYADKGWEFHLLAGNYPQRDSYVEALQAAFEKWIASLG